MIYSVDYMILFMNGWSPMSFFSTVEELSVLSVAKSPCFYIFYYI